MAAFNPGDRVLVNGTMVADVQVYDEGTGRLVLHQPEIPNTIYGPIEAYRLQLLVTEASAVEEEAVAEEAVAAGDDDPKDEFTTSGNF